MITPVNFEIDKLLIEEGIDMPVSPTIADVVMWLYEKHGIWINVSYKRHSLGKCFAYNIRQQNGIETYLWGYIKPTEAYEAAIEYTLNELI